MPITQSACLHPSLTFDRLIWEIVLREDNHVEYWHYVQGLADDRYGFRNLKHVDANGIDDLDRHVFTAAICMFARVR